MHTSSIARVPADESVGFAATALNRSEPPLPCTGARVRKLMRRLTTFYDAYLRESGLRLSQYSLLAHLDTRAQTLQTVADRLEMDRTTLTRALAPMLRAGWVANAFEPNVRQRMLVLTPTGAQLRRQARVEWERAQRALEARLGRVEVAELNRALESTLVRLKPLRNSADRT